MIKIAIIAGIRAQFMKLASLQRAINKWNLYSDDKVVPVYINAGQHYDSDLAGSFINELDIHFDIDLTPVHKNHEPIHILSNMIIELSESLKGISNLDWVIVFGDANSTLAGAIAASKLKLPLVHIEAGVRVGNIFRSEEQNRVVTDHLAVMHFLSSQKDHSNLANEGIDKHVYWTGDLIFDLVLELVEELPETYESYATNQFILATLHREENVLSDSILENVLYSLSSGKYPVLFIAHPRTRARIEALGLGMLPNIAYRNTLSYKQMLTAMKCCVFIVTDSGALQREAYYLRKRCLIRQDEPFWMNLVNAKIHLQVGTERNEIAQGLLDIENLVSQPYPVTDDLGDGSAGKKIIEHLSALKGVFGLHINQSESD